MQNLRIAFSKGSGLLSWLIRICTKSKVNHTLFLMQDDDGTEMVVGADWNGLIFRTRAAWEKGGSRVVNVPPLIHGIDDAWPVLRNYLDEEYDYSGLVGMLLVLIGRFWFHKRWRNPFHDRHALFCSEAAAVVLQAVNYPGSKTLDPAATDPGYLMRWMNEAYEDEPYKAA